MLARIHAKINTQLPPEVVVARQELKAKGWSYRSASLFLGVHYTHLARVLTGARTSRVLLRRIHALPPRRHTSTNNH